MVRNWLESRVHVPPSLTVTILVDQCKLLGEAKRDPESKASKPRTDHLPEPEHCYRFAQWLVRRGGFGLLPHFLRFGQR